MKNKKQRILVFSLLAITAVFCIFIYFQNSRVTVSEHSIISNRIPKAFSDFKIVQVSDLHNYNFGKDNFKLLSKIKELSPW